MMTPGKLLSIGALAAAVASSSCLYQREVVREPPPVAQPAPPPPSYRPPPPPDDDAGGPPPSSAQADSDIPPGLGGVSLRHLGLHDRSRLVLAARPRLGPGVGHLAVGVRVLRLGTDRPAGLRRIRVPPSGLGGGPRRALHSADLRARGRGPADGRDRPACLAARGSAGDAFAQRRFRAARRAGRLGDRSDLAAGERPRGRGSPAAVVPQPRNRHRGARRARHWLAARAVSDAVAPRPALATGQ